MRVLGLRGGGGGAGPRARARAAARAQADVLLMTTTPAAARWEATEELAEACRRAARARQAGLADTAAAFRTQGGDQPDRLFVNDRVHLSRAGHDLVAEVVLQAIAAGGAGAPAPADPAVTALPRIRVSQDRTHFVRDGSAARFLLWGFNYDHDDRGRLLEDYWEREWETVVADFGEMKAMGANVVRVHLQLGRFLTDATTPDRDQLDRLARLVRLAEQTGVYLDLTGLGGYHKADVPAWYDALGESERWAAQATFWRAIAGVGQGHAAVFCYDLMNEPILTGGNDKDQWLPGPPLDGKSFVQRITRDARGRSDAAIAGDWVRTLTQAIRAVDRDTLITVGEIPWSQPFPTYRPLFHAPEVGGPLDFVSVHFYPRKDQLDADLAALRAYEVGKPIVVEEFFPLNAGFEGTEAFLDRSRPLVDGWISFYWGKTVAELEQTRTLRDAITAGWLRRFQALAPTGTAPAP